MESSNYTGTFSIHATNQDKEIFKERVRSEKYGVKMNFEMRNAKRRRKSSGKAVGYFRENFEKSNQTFCPAMRLARRWATRFMAFEQSPGSRSTFSTWTCS